MAIIDPQKFINWAEDRFPDVKIYGNEVRINTIFPTPSGREDHDHSLWCNIKGGKKGQPPCFHCWKSDRHGSLLSLVMLVENCDYENAIRILGGENLILRNLERKLKELLHKKEEEPEETENSIFSLPPYACLISQLNINNFHRVNAEVYLFNRKLPLGNLMVCTSGKYRQRIIIPYYDRENKLIYFNSRYIGNSSNVPKYLGPPKNSQCPGKDDVLFMPVWPALGSKIYLTEGEFDALSIYYSGKLYAGAFGGKNLSEKQIEMIRPYQPILCLDADKAGKEGLTKMCKTLRSKGMRPLFVRPPKIYKDWNAMLQKTGPGALCYYISKCEKPVTDEALLRLLL